MILNKNKFKETISQTNKHKRNQYPNDKLLKEELFCEDAGGINTWGTWRTPNMEEGLFIQ